MEYMYLYYFAKDTEFPFFIQFGQHDMDMPLHHHVDFSELVIVLNGTATHIVNSEKYFVKKGDVFVINGNTSHGYENTEEFKICNIMYKPEHLHRVGNDLKKSSGYQALFVIEPFLAKEYNFKSKLQLNIYDYAKIKEIIFHMVNEYESKYQGYQTMLYSRFMELVVFLSRQYDIINSAVKDNVINLAKAVAYMESHFQESVSLKELADKAEFSARHFNRIFKENYKTTPMNYMLRLRIQYACSLLRKSKLPISDIAYESGFEDSNYFTRQFKKIIGLSPKDYRSNSNFTY
ncbi:helix-turn-helix domain-containing protein [Clostridium sp. 19966]|uniref:helix-turn-helix domain-containing protein n=1 Tax=Clostridium sp. 19966 TaxID=2768166 RepID=UPI0028DE7D50|nr:helix-turn-helix domain-containing protein [Clostridium sp. 19966]MDT8717481.1 helix-turn-helix domain-containing protein [Clostridium sp. 19966]